MFQKTYQRIILVVLLLIIVIYGLRKLIHYDKGQDLPLVLETVYGTDKIEKRSTSPPVPEVKHDKGQDLPLVHETVYHTDKIEKQSTSPPVPEVKHDKGQHLPLVHETVYGIDKIEKQSTSPPVPEVKHDKGQHLPLVHETVYHTDKIEKQSTSLPVSEVRKVNIKRQQNSISNSYVKIDSFLLNLIINGSKFKNYVSNLSSPQVESLIKQIEVSNLTSRKVQEEFLACGGISIFRQLKGPDPETPIPVIPSHQHCKKMSFKNSGPIVSLSSIPGSGNSYVRQLLESATGIYTGAVWCDPTYINAGMIGEGVDTNNVIAVKLHYYGPSGTKKFLNNDKSIYIIRSPFGAILSEHTRNVARNSQKYSSLGDSHVLEIDYKYENNPEWDNHVKQGSIAWKNEVKLWLTSKEFPILIVGYENLRKNTYAELKRMLDFLKHPYSENDILCAIKGSNEVFHRKHTRKDLHPYSPALQKFVLNQIKLIDAALLKHNISLCHPYTGN